MVPLEYWTQTSLHLPPNLNCLHGPPAAAEQSKILSMVKTPPVPIDALLSHLISCHFPAIYPHLCPQTCHVFLQVLVPWPVIEPRPSAVRAQSLSQLDHPFSSTLNSLSRLYHLSHQANLHWLFKTWIKCHLLINIKLVALISWGEGSYGDFSLSVNHILFELSWNAILLSSLNFKKDDFFSPFLWKLPCLSSPDGINYALWWSFKASVHVWLFIYDNRELVCICLLSQTVSNLKTVIMSYPTWYFQHNPWYIGSTEKMLMEWN